MHSKPIGDAQEWNDIGVVESPPNSKFPAEHLLEGVLHYINCYRFCFEHNFTLEDPLFTSPSTAQLNRNAFTATWDSAR